MRFGGDTGKCGTPEEQCARARLLGYTAVYADPALADTPEARRHYARVVREHGLTIAEVGAWSNPLSSVAEERKEALELCKRRLGIAEDLGARCCVNITGSRGSRWDGPHPANLTRETFDMIVACVREIIDEVRPTRTFYTLETMPWMYPDSVESYAALVEAVDRAAAAVHFDPVNLVCSPQRLFANGELIREFVARLGALIRSVHCKDIRISDQLTTHLDECRPGLGSLDHPALFRELSSLDPETTVMMEHLPEAEYPLAAAHLRAAAASVGVAL